jgi:hypothetical protein
MDSTGILPRYHPSICEKIEKGAKTGRLSAREVCSSLLFRNSSNRSAQMPTSGTSTVYERRNTELRSEEPAEEAAGDAPEVLAYSRLTSVVRSTTYPTLVLGLHILLLSQSSVGHLQLRGYSSISGTRGLISLALNFTFLSLVSGLEFLDFRPHSCMDMKFRICAI